MSVRDVNCTADCTSRQSVPAVAAASTFGGVGVGVVSGSACAYVVAASAETASVPNNVFLANRLLRKKDRPFCQLTN